ncbi:DUF4381 domain-containing protein [Flammeovirga agarivorans]|uniref:DUF4381 domain-containing protein n=1 Tax=Flammeovirga agarivorans TaxID=2726742 RepID=A0A7X8SKS6_9BACT|nr:DUF4381 domain-containing protein [Flammeovirga agarivorans]NLR91947.1 DUF4381 domain-containing protein [Flammeovirga agarivorans]
MINIKDNIGTVIPPPSVQFSFDTLGWKVVGGIILLLIVLLIWKLWKHHTKNLYRKEALQLLYKIDQNQASPNNVYEIDKLLRITAYTAYHENRIKQLEGKEWKLFLDQKIKRDVLKDDKFLMLQQFIFSEKLNPETKENFKDYYQYAEFWIRKHAL